MARDGYVPLGTLLTPEEAGMAHDLLVSAGVEALLEDQALSAVDPLVRLAIGGTKLLVREEDALRARALLDEAGLLTPASARPAEGPEIPEEEWAAEAPAATPPADPPRWLRSALFLTAAVAFVLALASALLGLARGGR
jgi:hypothetical protein